MKALFTLAKNLGSWLPFFSDSFEVLYVYDIYNFIYFEYTLYYLANLLVSAIENLSSTYISVFT